METEQDWKRIHAEHYVKGPTTEERIGVFLLFVVPMMFLISIAIEVWRYHNGL